MTLKLKTKPIPQGVINMGLTHVVVKLINSDSAEKYEADFLVDTGAYHPMAPAAELKKIGIHPLGRDLYELANGELQEFEYGSADLNFMGQTIGTRILFGPDDSQPILGALALQGAGFIVDLKNETVRKLEPLPLK
jgi:predicted aspartyl protease